MTAKLKIKVTLEQVYTELKNLNAESVDKHLNGSGGSLNTKGKQYFVFPILHDAGFDTWEKIHAEIVLISEKKSAQSKSVREALITTFYQVTQKTKEINNL